MNVETQLSWKGLLFLIYLWSLVSLYLVFNVDINLYMFINLLIC
jgi:hypothetical protein